MVNTNCLLLDVASYLNLPHYWRLFVSLSVRLSFCMWAMYIKKELIRFWQVTARVRV